MIALFTIISFGFHYIKPDSVIKNLDEEIHFIIYIEGLVEQEILLDYVPTVEQLFKEIEIENIYGFKNEKVLVHRQSLYIPLSLENKISLNNANIDELIKLNGVGVSTAQKIIDYRANKPYEILEDIQNIAGIGYKTYLNLRAYICL